MLFEIECSNNKTYLFDNETLMIWNPNGILVNFENDIRFRSFKTDKKISNKPLYNKNNPIVGKSNIDRIKLSLGFKCNYKCEYCWQRQFEQVAIDATPMLVDSFLEKLKKIDLSNCKRLEFWGGEPLVYIKTLKLLIPKLRQEYPEMDLIILSNGSLLTKELVDFFMQYRVIYGISHDGPAFTQYRDKEDPFETNLEAIQYLCHQSLEKQKRAPWFAVTLNRYNYKLPELCKFFEEKLGKDCPYYIHVDNMIECANKDDFDKFVLSDAEFLEFTKYALDAYLNPNNPLFDDFSKHLRNVLFALVNRISPWKDPYGCDIVSHKTLALNMRGDVLSCHSYPDDIVGNISALDKVSISKFTHWIYRDNCSSCPILFLCKGGKICTSNEEQHWVCKSMLMWKYPMFLAAWRVLFDTDINCIREHRS